MDQSSSRIEKKEKGRKRILVLGESGRRVTLKDFDGDFLERISGVQSSYLELILSSINLQEECGSSRLFRRNSNSEALDRGVLEVAIDRNNQW